MTLPLRQQQLYDALKGRGDVRWEELIAAIDAEPKGRLDQYLGPYIIRLNRRLAKEGQKVQPGALKGTLRLTVI